VTLVESTSFIGGIFDDQIFRKFVNKIPKRSEISDDVQHQAVAVFSLFRTIAILFIGTKWNVIDDVFLDKAQSKFMLEVAKPIRTC